MFDEGDLVRIPGAGWTFCSQFGTLGFFPIQCEDITYSIKRHIKPTGDHPSGKASAGSRSADAAESPSVREGSPGSCVISGGIRKENGETVVKH